MEKNKRFSFVFCLPLVKIGPKVERLKPIFSSLNLALPLLSVLSFLFGIFLMFSDYKLLFTGDFSKGIFIFLYLFSIVGHECGHVVAGVDANYPLGHAGILFLFLLPVGAYVSFDDSNLRALKSKRIQFTMSGIEVHLLLFGLFLGVAFFTSDLSLTFSLAAFTNAILAFVNILPASGLDGEKALSEALEVDSISRLSKNMLFNSTYRKNLFYGGIKGKFIICVLLLPFLAQVIEYVIEIGSVLFCIVCLLKEVF